MLFDTPIPTFPLTGEGAHRCRELSPIQAVHHFKDFAPLVVFFDEEDVPQIVTLQRAAKLLLPYLTQGREQEN